MSIINTTLLKPANVVVITVLAVAAHIISKPLLAAVSQKKA